MSEVSEKALEAVLERAIADFQTLISWTQLSAGASQQTYHVVIQSGGKETSLALRLAQPEGAMQIAISLATEAQLMQLAATAELPTPEVHYVLTPADNLGEGFLMQWISGETLGHRIVHSPDLEGARPSLARECGQILGRLHNIDWRAQKLEGALPCVEPQALVNDTWALYRDLNIPLPMIDYTWRWLQDNLPQSDRRTIVHGDFRNGNLIVDKRGIKAVLDWEMAHIGDPVRDLGWLCVNSWRFGNAALPVGGFGSLDDLLAGYSEVNSNAISLEEVHYWQVFGSFWWSVITLQMANSWRMGAVASLERPVIGRRSSEAQFDCAQLLIPGKFSTPTAAQSPTSSAQLPAPEELLQGVTKFLREDLSNQFTGHKKFLARVAASSLDIAAREFQLRPQADIDEQLRLQTLLQEMADLKSLRWNLVNQLRQGLNLSTPGLKQHLRDTVAAQLAIDQPNYWGLQAP